MASNHFKKFDENHPTMVAIRKYEQEIAALEIKRDEANNAQDWCMRHFYDAQLNAKRGNMQLLREKMGKRCL